MKRLQNVLKSQTNLIGVSKGVTSLTAIWVKTYLKPSISNSWSGNSSTSERSQRDNSLNVVSIMLILHPTKYEQSCKWIIFDMKTVDLLYPKTSGLKI